VVSFYAKIEDDARRLERESVFSNPLCYLGTEDYKSLNANLAVFGRTPC
jgi:hypothetical protein